MKKTFKTLLRWLLKGISLVITIISLPVVRDLIWGKLTKKAKDKIIDVEARVVDKEK